MHQGTWLQLVCMHSLRDGACTHAIASAERTARICSVLAPSMAQCVSGFPVRRTSGHIMEQPDDEEEPGDEAAEGADQEENEEWPSNTVDDGLQEDDAASAAAEEPQEPGEEQSAVLYNQCIFCGLMGAYGQPRKTWRTTKQCNICHAVVRQGWRNQTARALLNQMSEDSRVREQFNQCRLNYLQQRRSGGLARVRIPAASVTRVNRNRRTVEDAPYRWILVADYPSMFGGRSPEDDGLVPVADTVDGVLEYGVRIYEFDPASAGSRGPASRTSSWR